MEIHTTNPTTGKPIKSYPSMSAGEVTNIIQHSHEAYLQWRQWPVAERTEPMLRAADLLLANIEQYASLITAEMGKPIVHARAEITKCANNCRYFASHGPGFVAPRQIATELNKSYVTYQPLGVIFAIMPWNFPFWQVFRFAAPTLMAGNAVILKHASIASGCALAIEQIFQQAGFPVNLFRTLLIEGAETEQVIANPLIAGVTLTGSERTGRSVAGAAGTHLKKTVLELGGNDPYVILEDADLAHAAQQCVQSRLANSGQVCIAAKRLIVVKAVKAEFQRLVMEELAHYVLGDPTDEKVKLGPLAREELRKDLHEQVQKSVAQGAVLLRGGKIPEGPGFFYPITILDQVRKGMTAYEEELFGPIITFIEAEDEATALHIANDSRYGLAAAVFTRDLAHGEKIAAKQLIAGTCYVNQLVNSDPRLPFGGVKSSGFGRELAEFGMHEFMNIKTVGVKAS